ARNAGELGAKTWQTSPGGSLYTRRSFPPWTRATHHGNGTRKHRCSTPPQPRDGGTDRPLARSRVTGAVHAGARGGGVCELGAAPRPVGAGRVPARAAQPARCRRRFPGDILGACSQGCIGRQARVAGGLALPGSLPLGYEGPSPSGESATIRETVSPPTGCRPAGGADRPRAAPRARRRTPRVAGPLPHAAGSVLPRRPDARPGCAPTRLVRADAPPAAGRGERASALPPGTSGNGFTGRFIGGWGDSRRRDRHRPRHTPARDGRGGGAHPRPPCGGGGGRPPPRGRPAR